MRNPESIPQITMLMAVVLAVSLLPVPAQNSVPSTRKDRARVLLATPIPALDGAHLKTSLVEVNYGPGEASPPHTHPCAVTGYVVEGSLRMRVEGQPEKLYSVGESFYEAPNGVHAVSANASATQPAKLIAYFVCDHDAPLSVNVPASHSGGN
jgi:quercetin dioxygenase-like cupin family protein